MAILWRFDTFFWSMLVKSESLQTSLQTNISYVHQHFSKRYNISALQEQHGVTQSFKIDKPWVLCSDFSIKLPLN